MATVRGGEKLERALAALAARIAKPRTLRVGFLENATYPDGTPVAMIAAIQNYGAPVARIPPRPFFSNMVADKRDSWAPAIAGLLQKNMDVDKTLELTGHAIAGQLRQSIKDTNDPPLALSTIKRKGHSKPLVDTGHMLGSVDFDVK
jgi:hypothetical protein